MKEHDIVGDEIEHSSIKQDQQFRDEFDNIDRKLPNHHPYRGSMDEKQIKGQM